MKQTNDEFAGNLKFERLCEAAGIKATKRQAAKYRNQTGKAWKHEHMVAAIDRCVNNQNGGSHETN